MRCLVQRVLSASVSVEGKTIGSIEKGYLVLLGVKNTDTEAVADKMLKKILEDSMMHSELSALKTKTEKRIFPYGIFPAPFLLSVSLPSMQTPKKGIVPALSKPVTPRTQMLSTNIF